MHAALERIREATIGTPFEGQLWLVGGAVRDEWLGRPQPNDYDIVTELSAQGLADLLFQKGISAIQPVTYARFGTALVQVEGVDIELATARRESYAPDSRKPEVEPATLIEDARRRDFTVNTLMRNLHSEEVYDPLGKAIQDLEDGVIRTPLEPEGTFRDDPLRMLRAIRFLWSLGFSPAPGLYEAIRAERRRLEIISGERIRDELVKMLRLPDGDRALDDLQTTGLLEVFAPELDQMKGVTQGSYHHLDVWDHTRLVVRKAFGGDTIVLLAALFHDVGKPPTRSIDRSDIRFYQHEKVGAELARRVMGRLRFSGDEIEVVEKLVRNHMRLQTAPELTPAAARRLMRDLGPDLERLLQLVQADVEGLRPGVKAMDVEAIRRRIEEVAAKTPVQSLQSPLSGEEVMALLETEEGPQVGQAKALLLERVLEGSVAPDDRASAALTLLRKIELPPTPANRILAAIAQFEVSDRPLMIGISGFCGCGKSVLTRALASRLPESVRIEVDDFWDSSKDRVADDWPAIDRRRIRDEVLLPARGKQPIRFQLWDWERSQPGEFTEIPPARFYFIDGIGLFHPDIADLFDLKVWVEGPMAACHAAGMRRDRDEYGEPHEREWREVWIENDRRFFETFRPKEAADLVVPWFGGALTPPLGQ